MRIEREIARGPIRAETLVGGGEILRRLAADWRALCDEGPCDEPFYRPEWIEAWWEAFGGEGRLRVVAAFRGGRLRAVLPLVQTRERFRGVPVRLLRGAANVHSCRFDLIHGAEDADEAGRAVWKELGRTGGFEVLEIPDVPEGGLALRLLGWAERDGHPVGTWESMRSPFVPLPPGGTEPAVDAKFRANLRRRRRRLEEKGEVRFERIERADPATLAAFYELERSGWKGARGTAIACDGATRRFYDRIAAWAERERCLSLYALRLGERPVAMHFGLTWKRKYFLPKPAYDESHRECSPGQLLMQEVLRDCSARGLEELDFLGPWMEWKADWTGTARSHHWCYVFRAGPIGAALCALKFRLPAWLRGK